jgi:hypothetical protein
MTDLATNGFAYEPGPDEPRRRARRSPANLPATKGADRIVQAQVSSDLLHQLRGL